MYNKNMELTKKQLILLDLLSKGYNHKEIGEMFGLTRQMSRKECTQALRIQRRKNGYR